MTNLEYIKSLGAKELAGLICTDYGCACGMCKEESGENPCSGSCYDGIIAWLLSERQEELKPCPFCGGEARVHESAGGWSFVFCEECEAELRGETKAEAIEAWNKRV